MAVDKAVDSAVLDGYFEDIADSIRTKTGTQSTYTPAQMSTAIDDIPSSDLSEYFDNVINNTSYGQNTNWVTLIKKIKSPVYVRKSLSYAFYGYPASSLPQIIFDGEYYISDVQNAFSNCANLTAIDIVSILNAFPTQINNMTSMFYGCKELKNISFSGVDLTNARQMPQMFQGCSKIESIDFSNTTTGNIGGLTAFCSDCSQLRDITFGTFNTSNCTGFNMMFAGCSYIETIDLSGFDFQKATDVSNMFMSCNALKNLTFGTNLGKGYLTSQGANTYWYGLSVGWSPLLTHDSLMSIINNLYDIASAGVQPQQLTLGSTNLAKLTSAEIAIATNKGWTVS